MFSLFLPPEEVSESEKKYRSLVNFIFRLSAASFFSYHCFEFLFSPVWMHGYVWSLNQEDNDDSIGRMGPGPLVSIQNAQCSIPEKFIFSILIALINCALFWMTGFRHKPRSVWYLLKLSMLFGFVAGAIRCLQVKQRLYSVLHEGFYVYFLTFCSGVILTVQTEDFWKIKKKAAMLTATKSDTETESNKIVK